MSCSLSWSTLEWSSNVNGTLLVMFGMLLSVYPCDLQTWTAHSWWCLACCCQCIRVIFKRERHTPGDAWHVVVSVSVWSSNVNGTLLVMFGMLLSVYPCDLQTWTAHSWWCLACCCQCIRVIFKRERHTPGDAWHVVVSVSVWSSNVNGTLLVMFGMLLSVYPCDLQMWTAHSWWCLACCCQCIREWSSNVNGTLLVMACCCLRVIFKRERHTPGDVWHVVVCISVWSSWTAHSWWCLACCCQCIRWSSNVNGGMWTAHSWWCLACVVSVSVWSSNVNGTLLVMFGMLLSVYPWWLQTWTAHSWWCLACCCQCIRVTSYSERHAPVGIVLLCTLISNPIRFPYRSQECRSLLCSCINWMWHAPYNVRHVTVSVLMPSNLMYQCVLHSERHAPYNVRHVTVSVLMPSNQVYQCGSLQWTARSLQC